MNKLLNIFNYWLNQDNFQLVSKLFFLYVVVVMYKVNYANPIIVFPIILLLLFVGLMNKSFLQKPWFWILYALFFTVNLIFGYFVAANHHFVVIYVCWLLAIAAPNRENVLAWNAKVLICLIMLLAVVQKFISIEYMDGSYFALVGYEGKFFVYLDKIIPFDLIPNENMDLIKNEVVKTPLASTEIPLKEPWANYVSFMKAFGWFVLIGELLVGILLFTKWKHFKNITFLLVLIGILLTRQETGFLLVLTTLFIAQLSKEDKKTYLPYYMGFCILCFGLVVSGLGFL